MTFDPDSYPLDALIALEAIDTDLALVEKLATQIERDLESQADAATSDERWLGKFAGYRGFSEADIKRVQDARESLPSMSRQASFLLLYSLFERALSVVCRSIYEDSDLSIRVNDLRSRGVQGARQYLCDVAGLSIATPEDWDTMHLYQQLRNRLAHVGLEVDKGTLAQLLRLDGVEGGKTRGELRLTDTFIPSATRAFRDLAAHIKAAIDHL